MSHLDAGINTAGGHQRAVVAERSGTAGLLVRRHVGGFVRGRLRCQTGAFRFVLEIDAEYDVVVVVRIALDLVFESLDSEVQQFVAGRTRRIGAYDGGQLDGQIVVAVVEKLTANVVLTRLNVCCVILDVLSKLLT